MTGQGCGPADPQRSLGWLASGAAGCGLLLGAWYALHSESVRRADVRAGEAIRELGSAGVDRFVVATTDLGSMYAVAGTAAVLAATGRPRTAADVAGLGALAWTVAQQSKTVVRRERPYEVDGVRRLVREPAGSSFPSGHAAVAVATTSMLAERVRWRPAGWLLRGLGGYVAASRVYVGVHYPTDVLGGAGLGLVLAGVWRGPLARVGRTLTTAAGSTARRVAGPLARGAVAVGFGARAARLVRGGEGARTRRSEAA